MYKLNKLMHVQTNRSNLRGVNKKSEELEQYKTWERFLDNLNRS